MLYLTLKPGESLTCGDVRIRYVRAGNSDGTLVVNGVRIPRFTREFNLPGIGRIVRGKDSHPSKAQLGFDIPPHVQVLRDTATVRTPKTA